MKRCTFVLLLWLASVCTTAWATAPQAFTTESLAAIQAKHAGRPFILSLWSANNCGHCIVELTMFGKLAKTHKNLPLVLVAVDAPEFAATIEQTQKRLGLARMESWMFADEIPERLRHAIDPRWRGEIPRTYLYDAQHGRETVAGVLREAKLRAWLKQHVHHRDTEAQRKAKAFEVKAQ